jgi:hypothetical protein
MQNHCLQQLFNEVEGQPGVEFPIETRSNVALSVA